MSAKEKPWYRVWPNNVAKQLNYSQIPLNIVLEKTAGKFPEKTAIVYFEKQITYKELDSLSNQFAEALGKIGVNKGDKVAIFLPNIPQFVIAYFAILKAGAVLTAISPLHKEREVEYQLCDSEAKAIIVLDSLLPIVEKINSKTALKHIIVTTLDEYSSTEIPPIEIKSKLNVLYFKSLLTENAQIKPPRISIDPNKDLATLQYTGGTTGTPKGAMLTHMNLLSNATAFATWIRGTIAKETFLVALPLFHIYGMTTSMNVPISLAGRMILLPRFLPSNVLATIQKHKVTVFCGVPTMYSILLANPELRSFDLTSIRVCISGASPLPPQVQKTFMEITGGFLAEGYGLTEASPVTHCNPVDRTMKTVRVGSIGLPMPDTDARVLDLKTGTQELKPGETGELAIRGPQVMKGYWQNQAETAKVLRDGWLYTGDIARMDDDGYFYITDRKKNLIKYKDYSVYPREIEDVLYEHPNVKLCAVIGKPDSLAGEIPKAFVVLKDDQKISTEEIMGFVNEKLAPYKAIRSIEFRKNLPISSAGKVLRRVLQQQEKNRS